MTLLLTLDFPPEYGGIQRYLYDRVRHRFSAADRVLVGRGAPLRGGTPALPCPAAWVGNPLSLINKKWSIVNLCLHALYAARAEGACLECGNVYAGIAAWFASLFRPVRYRVYTYGGELAGLRKRTPVAALLRAVLRRAEKIYALGGYTGSLLKSAGIANEILVEPPRIELPADAGVRRPRAPETFTPSEPLRLLAVGRYVPHKGHAVLIDACRRLPHDLHWHLTIAGSGPQQRHLEAQIDRAGLAQRISLRVGPGDSDLEIEYRIADLFVLPSLELPGGSEGFGIVLLEAMAHGVPVAASRTGGIPEVLADGACGLLVEPGDATALAEGIVALAHDTVRRQEYVEKAGERLRERYVWR